MAGERLSVFVSETEHRLDLLRAAADAFAEEGFRALEDDRDWAMWCGGLADLFYRLAQDMAETA